MRSLLRTAWFDLLHQTEVRALSHVRYGVWPSPPEGQPSIGASLAELDRAQLRAASTDIHRGWR